jgi:hypothetical protein
MAVLPSSDEPEKYSVTFLGGSLFVSDAGSSHGGFEMTVEYSIIMSPAVGDTMYTGGVVSLEFRHQIGLDDPIDEHLLEMRMTYEPSADAITLQKAKTRLVMPHFEDDSIWDGKYDGHYIASWGGDAPPEEIRGEITPRFFGLPDHYYVEMRLRLIVTPVL